MRISLQLLVATAFTGACIAAYPPDSPSTSSVASPEVPAATEDPTGVPPTTQVPATTASASTSASDTAETGGPDTAFVNAAVLTMDEAVPRAEAVAVDDGRIVAVGSRAEVEGLVGESTIVVDLQGRTLLPGFIDSHAHWIGDWSVRYGSPNEAIQSAVASGWTTIVEMFASPEHLDLYTQLDNDRRLPLDVVAYLPINYGDDRFGESYLDYAPGAQLTPHVRIGGIKLFVDSGDYGEKLLSQPYIDNPGHLGTGFWSQADLSDAVATADTAGFQVAAHTGGDAALDLILNAFEDALEGRPNELRHRVEHVMIARDDQIERMAELGVVASVQLSFFHSDWADEYASTMGPSRVNWIGRWRDLLDGGVTTIGSTDQPYGYGTVGSSMRAISQAVTRIGEGGAPPPDWMLDQRISIQEALRLITADAAWGIGEEAMKGTISAGKRADLVVLSADPTAVDAAELESISVEATIVDGIAVHCGTALLWLCGRPSDVDSEPVPGAGPQAAGLTITASSSRDVHGPDLALDGLAEGDSYWSSGADAPGWIQIDFEQPSTVEELRFTVFQNPASETVHVLEIRVGGIWREVTRFEGFTTTGDVLQWIPDSPVEETEGFRITTTTSLSWPEWYEIEVVRP